MSYPQFYELVCKRYSCRNFDSQHIVDDSLIRAVIETAQLAPSACNRQPWHFVAVRDASARATMLSKSRPAFLDAPVLLVCLGDHSQAWHRPLDNKDHTDVDVAIAIEHICLAAASLDMATCWVCNFDVAAVRELLQLPDNLEPIALIPLGFAAPDQQQPAKIRKPVDDILSWEKL